MSPHSHDAKSDLAKVVEKQMRNWELARAQRIPSLPAEPHHDVASFVTISRSVGSGGHVVATLVGERLRWPVFDREILQAMAGDDQVRARLYETMDERDVTWLDDAIRWLIKGELRKEDYLYRLTETVLTLARHGPAVYVGRGIDLILPSRRGLRVRIEAPLPRRVEAFSLRHNVPLHTAEAEVERIDRQRADFRRHRFGASANAPSAYDLVINLEWLTPEHATELILTALRQRGLEQG